MIGGSFAGQSVSAGTDSNIIIGNNGSGAAGCCVMIGGNAGMLYFGGGTGGTGGMCTGTFTFSCNVSIAGSLSKSAGSFRIMHPDPAKSCAKDLWHSFVESPNEGEGIYRWQVETSNCANVITLPDYYRHLNKNDMVWVSPYKHFGAAYGEVTADQCCLVVCSNVDGCYNVLLLGTRKDPSAVRAWKGTERDATNSSPFMEETHTYGEHSQMVIDSGVDLDQVEKPILSTVYSRNVEKGNAAD